MTVQARTCHHCRRAAPETLHGRAGAVVGFFRTVTGVPRADSVDDPRQRGQALRVQRVDTLYEIVTCAECWRTPTIRAALELARRSGVLPGA
jgi:hypothetical protein